MHICIFHSTVKEVFIVCGLKTTDVFVGEWATFSCQLSGRGTLPRCSGGWMAPCWKNSPFSEIGLSQGQIYTLTLKNLAHRRLWHCHVQNWQFNIKLQALSQRYHVAKKTLTDCEKQ